MANKNSRSYVKSTDHSRYSEHRYEFSKNYSKNQDIYGENHYSDSAYLYGRDGAAAKYYTQDSLAYDAGYYPVPYKEEPVKKKPSFPIREANKQRKERLAHCAKLFLIMGVVFAGCILTMGVSASVSSQRVKNNRLKDELAAIKAENDSVEADMSDEISIEYIKSEAMSRLGMVEPQDYQIVHVTVPEQSYTVSYNTETSKEASNFSIKDLLNLFKGE